MARSVSICLDNTCTMVGVSDSLGWSNNIAMFCKTTLDLPPSCLEFVPEPSEAEEPLSHLRNFYHEYFVVGTYYLEKEERNETSRTIDEEREESSLAASKPQSKNGSLILFRYQNEQLQIVQTIPYPSAVFDLHFLPASPIFAIVSSSGTVAIFKVVEKQPTLEAQESIGVETIAIHQVFAEDVAPTYFTWAPNSQQTMAITTSDGGVYFVNFSQDHGSFQILNSEEPVLKHTEYAWCCSFSPSGDCLYSGGDDNKLRLESLNTSLSNVDPEASIEPSGFYPKGLPGHDAGVTFILPLLLPKIESTLLLTGSYDDKIRLYAIPPYGARPKILSELHLGGGVWRLKFLDSTTGSINDSKENIVQHTVLASCMHAGAKILSVIGTRQSTDEGVEPAWQWEIKILAEMHVHRSMNYASDAQPATSKKEEGKNGSRLCVSSSFYDRLLCAWKWNPDEHS